MAVLLLSDSAAKRSPRWSAPASFASMASYRFFFSAVVCSFVLLGTAAQEDRQVEEPGIGAQANLCPDTSEHLFTKWTTGGCLGDGDDVIIGGLAPPVVVVASPQCAASSLDLVSGPDGRGCVCNFDQETDYFPVKVAPQFSKLWSVEYMRSYKVVDNLEDGTKYVLLLYPPPTHPGPF